MDPTHDNQMIVRLPRSERRQVLNQCETVEMVPGSVLCEADVPADHAYFPTSGFISLVTALHDHQPLELGLIGDEGMLGMTLVLEIDNAPTRAVVQGAGNALRIERSQLRALLTGCPELRRSMQRYTYVVLAQLAQNAACTHFHEIEPRLARWLLMTHDRAHGDHFSLTHELLAAMLGVRRSGVTIAAGALQQRELISYARGEIRIIDRPGLERASCECYAAMIDDYTQLLH